MHDKILIAITYGDGFSDVDIVSLINLHKERGKLATVTAVRPPGRFGSLQFDGEKVTAFVEKPQGDGGFINGGFFVLSSKVFNLISGDQVNFEKDILKDLADENELVAYEHDGFWRPMDTLRDKTQLEDLWNAGCESKIQGAERTVEGYCPRRT